MDDRAATAVAYYIYICVNLHKERVSRNNKLALCNHSVCQRNERRPYKKLTVASSTTLMALQKSLDIFPADKIPHRTGLLLANNVVVDLAADDENRRREVRAIVM